MQCKICDKLFQKASPFNKVCPVCTERRREEGRLKMIAKQDEKKRLMLLSLKETTK